MTAHGSSPARLWSSAISSNDKVMEIQDTDAYLPIWYNCGKDKERDFAVRLLDSIRVGVASARANVVPMVVLRVAAKGVAR